MQLTSCSTNAKNNLDFIAKRQLKQWLNAYNKSQTSLIKYIYISNKVLAVPETAIIAKAICCYFSIGRDDLQRIKSRCKCSYRLKLRHHFYFPPSIHQVIRKDFVLFVSFHTFQYILYLIECIINLKQMQIVKYMYFLSRIFISSTKNIIYVYPGKKKGLRVMKINDTK